MARGDTFSGGGRSYTVAYVVPAVVQVPSDLADTVIAGDLYGKPEIVLQRWDAQGNNTKQGIYVRVDLGKLLPNFRHYFVPNASQLAASFPKDGPDPRVACTIGMELDKFGTEAEFLRELFHRGNGEICRKASKSLEQGKKIEDVARWVVRARNDLKVQVRGRRPYLFQKVAELRNQYLAGYKNPVGPSYEQLKATPKTDAKIIDRVEKTSVLFNNAGKTLRFVGATLKVASFVFALREDSPESLPPLPKSEEEMVECEITRLKLGIRPEINIDRQGHPKKNSYLQIGMSDLLHAEDELDQETDEILWYFGAPITYTYDGMSWTVPGKKWGQGTVSPRFRSPRLESRPPACTVGERSGVKSLAH
jgi:hypothetical protein